MLIMGDSQLVLKQLSGEFKCTSVSLAPYYTATIQLLEEFKEISFLHVPEENNWEADELAQIASGLRFSNELTTNFSSKEISSFHYGKRNSY